MEYVKVSIFHMFYKEKIHMVNPHFDLPFREDTSNSTKYLKSRKMAFLCEIL